jgi:hypothetical protein
MGGVAIHATMTHTGEVLLFQDVEGEAGVDRTSRVRVWDPATGQSRDANLGYDRDVFCAGHNVLPDGRVFVSGGHDFTTGKKQDPIGVAESDTYDPESSGWAPTPPLGQKRWYPTNVGLGNGKTLIFGGQEGPDAWANTVDSYDPASNTMTRLPASATTALNTNYPRMHLLPNGTIVKVGISRMSQYFDPESNQWSDVSPMLYGNRTQGTSVLLPGLDKVMAIGGRASGAPATETVEILDTSQAQPRWRYTAPMHFPRVHANAVTLPDGKVLVVGGGAANKVDGPVTAAELYDPVSETWTVMESQVGGRMYHSTALLLPDGRVLSAGQDSGGYATTGEIFSPPYMFAGSRPTITGVPGSTDYGKSFSFTSAQAADISKLTLIHPGSMTHSTDTEQRSVALDFTTSGSTITATAPVNGNTAPPGYYMLFAVDSAGVPSVASWVRVGGSAPPAGDTTAPSVPGNVGAAGSAGRVDVTWSESTDNVGVTGYTVRRDGAVIATVPNGASYADTTVTTGTTYRYTVQAFDAAGNTSAQSAEATATVPQNPPGAGIALRGAATGVNTATAQVTVPMPAATAGDLVLASVDVRGQPAITPPPGWTTLRTDTSGTAIRKATYWRTATATEPESYTWRFNNGKAAVGTILSYNGVSTTAPIEASSGQPNAASKSIQAPSLTTASPDALVVGLFGIAKNAAVAPPTGMTERSEASVATGTTGGIATGETADYTPNQPGPTGAKTATATLSAPSIGHLVALRPAG